MDKEKKTKIQAFAHDNAKRIAALRNWINIKMKTFTLLEALECIWDAADGKVTEVGNIIDQITTKRRVHGRSQVYAEKALEGTDIVRDNDKNLVLINYDPDKEAPSKGQKVERNPKIFKKGDDVQVKKPYQQTEEKLYDLGQVCRELYPNASNEFLTTLMKCIRDYAAAKKITTDKVIERMKKGRIEYVPSVGKMRSLLENKRRTVVIDESIIPLLENAMAMTEYKFYNCVKRFLADLLDNPVNAEPNDTLKQYGLTRYKMLKQLNRVGLIEKDEKINDKNGDGEFKTATMKVKYKVPKKNFEHNLKKLYIRLFEKNEPPRRRMNEDGEGGAMGGATSCDASSGQFVQPLFGKQPITQKSLYKNRLDDNVDESTVTNSVGNYPYDVPFPGDEESLARKNGENGSVSINKA